MNIEINVVIRDDNYNTVAQEELRIKTEGTPYVGQMTQQLLESVIATVKLNTEIKRADPLFVPAPVDDEIPF